MTLTCKIPNPFLILFLNALLIKNIAMQPSLQQQLLEYPFKPKVRQHSQQPTNNSILRIRPMKYLIVGTMSLIFLGYRFLWKAREEECVWDLLHQWTAGINQMLNSNEFFYQVMITIAQQSIELNIFCLIVISTWKVNNLRVHLLMGLFYGLRGILLNIERFPYPPNIRWDAPIIPSLTVPYGITRDYFYSGHTGLMMFSTFEWYRLGYRSFFYISLLLTPQVILVLLSTRVHYSIDIIAAAIMVLWLQRQALKKVLYFDKCWSVVYLVIEELIKYVRNILN